MKAPTSTQEAKVAHIFLLPEYALKFPVLLGPVLPTLGTRGSVYRHRIVSGTARSLESPFSLPRHPVVPPKSEPVFSECEPSNTHHGRGSATAARS